jgi:hypothetical protein
LEHFIGVAEGSVLLARESEVLFGGPFAVAAPEATVLAPFPGDPVALRGVLRPKLLVVGCGQGMQTGARKRLRGAFFGLGGLLVLEEPLQMRLDGEPGKQAVYGGVGLHLGRVEVKLLAPYQPRLDAQLDDLLEEAAEDLKAVAFSDTGEAGVVGQRFAQVVAQVPADAEAVGSDLHKLALRAQILEKEDELELEEDHRVDAGATRRNGVAVFDQLPNEREVKGAFQATVEIILRDEFFERDIFERGEVALLNGHHGSATSR